MPRIDTGKFADRPPGRKVSAASTGGTYQSVLAELLSQIESIDFRGLAGLDEDAKISRKLHVVISVDEITETAIANNWAFALRTGLFMFSTVNTGRW